MTQLADRETRATGRTARAKARRARHNQRHRERVPGCRSCALRAAWEQGKFSRRQRHRPPRPDAWDPDTEGRRLAELVGYHTPQEIADILNQEFHRLDGIARTEAAVVVQITRRGLSRWMAGYRLHEVEQLFHFDHRAIHRHWLQPRLLVPSRTFNGRGTARDNYVFTQSSSTGRPQLLERLFTEDELRRLIWLFRGVSSVIESLCPLLAARLGEDGSAGFGALFEDGVGEGMIVVAVVVVVEGGVRGRGVIVHRPKWG